MSQTTPPPAAIRPLPVSLTVYQAYGMVLSQLPAVFKAAALPFVLSIVLGLATLMAPGSGLWNVVLTILGFVPYTLFGVAWHRLSLLGPAAAPPPLVPAWTRRHWRFLGYAVIVILTIYTVSLPFLLLGMGMAPPGPGGAPMAGLPMAAVALAAMVGLVYVMMRLSFVFPAVAVGESYGLGLSWAHTRGQGFRLIGAVLLTLFPMVMVVWMAIAALTVLVMPDPGAMPDPEGATMEETMRFIFLENAPAFVISQLVLSALNYILMALMVSVISIAFKTCTGWVPAAGGPPPAPSEKNG
jgi:hypothetical protein